METFVLNYIEVTPDTSYTYEKKELLLEREVNNNFFAKSFNFAEDVKSQAPNFNSEFYHLYIPIQEEGDGGYIRSFETLPTYHLQEKKYVQFITHLGDSFSQNNKLFQKFIKDYKNFLVDINTRKDIMSKIEFIFGHSDRPHYDIREIKTQSVNIQNQTYTRL
jgi:hypothetical protein